MPGARQPIALLEAKGRKNLTKTEKAQRRATEVTAPSDKVRPSSHLPKDIKREFNKIAKELKAIGIITNLDVNALERYVIAQTLYSELSIRLLEDPLLILDKTVLAHQDKLFKQCRAAAMDLGLTISSRCKLVMPQPKEVPKEANPFAQFVSRK